LSRISNDVPDFKTIADFRRDNGAAIVGTCRAARPQMHQSPEPAQQPRPSRQSPPATRCLTTILAPNVAHEKGRIVVDAARLI
jgi:hypothetical protein